MMGDRDWSEVSFKPNGKAEVVFGNASIKFPSIDAQEIAENLGEELNIEDIIGPIHIRIQSSSISAIPEFLIGQVGMFKGKHLKYGLTYHASNATVIDSRPGDLLLECVSLDRYTSPVSFTVE